MRSGRWSNGISEAKTAGEHTDSNLGFFNGNVLLKQFKTLSNIKQGRIDRGKEYHVSFCAFLSFFSFILVSFLKKKFNFILDIDNLSIFINSNNYNIVIMSSQLYRGIINAENPRSSIHNTNNYPATQSQRPLQEVLD